MKRVFFVCGLMAIMGAFALPYAFPYHQAPPPQATIVENNHVMAADGEVPLVESGRDIPVVIAGNIEYNGGTVWMTTGTVVTMGTTAAVAVPMNVYTINSNGAAVLTNWAYGQETVSIDGVAKTGYRSEGGGIVVDQNCVPKQYTPEQHVDMMAQMLGKDLSKQLKRGEAPEQLAHRKGPATSQYAKQ